MAIEAPNIQWPTGVPYVVGDRGTAAVTVKDISPFVPETLVGSENFETDPISGSGTWTLTTTTPHSGLRALRSAVIGNLGVTNYTFNVPVGATQIRFWWRVSSEATFDLFQVLANAVVVFTQSGLTDVWAAATINLAGATTVTFRYSKDGSSAGGLDRAMIDDIDWISIPSIAAVQNYEPLHLDPTNQLKVTDSAVAIVLANKATEATLTSFKAENDSNLDAVNAELDAQTTLLTHIDGDLHAANTSLDNIEAATISIDSDFNVQLSTRASEATLAAFKTENDSNLDAVNTELDAQTVLLTHIDADLHVANTSLDNIEFDVDASATILFTIQQLIAIGVSGTATNGVQISTAGATQISILAANASRKGAVITNVGVATVRVGVTGVTATTGFARLQPGDTLTLSMPFCPDEQLFMIREGAVNGTVLVAEQT